MGESKNPDEAVHRPTMLEDVLPANQGPWWKQRHLIRLNFCIFCMLLFSSSNGYDGSMMNGLQILPQWESFMGTPTGSWLGFINSLYYIGMGVMFPFATYVSNKWGRKPGIYVGCVFVVAGTVLQMASANRGLFMAGRAMLGLGAAWWYNAVPVLITEIAYPTHRSIASALYMCGYYVGGVIASWVTFGTRNSTTSWGWRIPVLLQILCPILAFPGLLMIQESPRWLISVGRREEARAVLATIHGGGDATSPLVNFEIIEIEETIRAESEAHASGSYSAMVKTPGNRHRLLITVTVGFFSQWAGNGVVAYYLDLVLNSVGITSTTDQLLISACLQVWNLIWAVIAAVSIDKAGRRFLWLSSAAVMLISYVIITALSGTFAQSGSSGAGLAVIPFLFLYYAGYDISLTPLLVAYPVEIWQFNLRTRGNAVTWLVAIISIIFNTFVNPIALSAIGWKYYLVYVAILICYAFVTYFCYPETKGYTLEEMAVVFDGDNAAGQCPEESVKMTALAISQAEHKENADA